MHGKICYLCGKPINGVASKDHIPPKQFFAEEFRKKYNLSKLKTLNTHEKCNINYKLDEEYFLNAISPLAIQGQVGEITFRSLYKKIK